MNTSLLFESLAKHISLSDAERDILAGLMQERKVRKGQFLVHENGIARSTHFVTKGSVITYFLDLEGKQHIVQFAIEGWWISDLNSFISQEPATFNVQALEDSELLELPADKVEIMYNKVPQMERYFRIITQRAFVSFQHRIVQNISMAAEDRYLAFKKKYPKIESRIAQKLVASYLGISAEFLSKIKKRIAEQELGIK
ncbi:MAG TPA: Crp/Fnr family transcriptional regulator [Chryseosolibacter sp.]